MFPSYCMYYRLSIYIYRYLCIVAIKQGKLLEASRFWYLSSYIRYTAPMNLHENHAKLLHDFFIEQQQIFDSSSQAIYAFLNDGNIVCNEKFATLLGYSFPAEWATVQQHFIEAFVDAKSQQTVVSAYQNAIQKMEGATMNVTWKKKTGETINTTVILVPLAYKNHILALHFVSR